MSRLFEISTDKVDAEIPVAGGGRPDGNQSQGRRDRRRQQRRGDDWDVVRGLGAGAGSAASTAARCAARVMRSSLRTCSISHSEKAAAPQRKTNGRSATASKPVEDDSRKQRSSPLVRRIARDNDVDISQIHGSGLGGRVTKNDILGYIEPGRRDCRSRRDSGLGSRDRLEPDAAPRARTPASPTSTASRSSRSP